MLLNGFEFWVFHDKHRQKNHCELLLLVVVLKKEVLISGHFTNTPASETMARQVTAESMNTLYRKRKQTFSNV